MADKAIMVPNPLTPCKSVIFNPDICNGCNACVNVCGTDIMMPNSEKGRPPILLYPDECWFCGCCVEHCPRTGAISMRHPLNQKIGWKRKVTGEIYRIGMTNPPPPVTRPPVGMPRKTTIDG